MKRKFLPAPKGYRKKILHESDNVQISLLEKIQFCWWWPVIFTFIAVALIYFDVLNITVIKDGKQIFTTN